MSPDTLIRWRFTDDEWEQSTWKAFAEADDIELAAIELALNDGRMFRGGGGAAPEFEVDLVTMPTPKVREITPTEAGRTYALDFEDASRAFVAEWADREGCYVQGTNGQFWTQVSRDGIESLSEAEVQQWLWQEVEVRT